MQEYHLLKVEQGTDSRLYHLNASTVTVGSSTMSGIRIEDDEVLAQHFILKKFPLSDSQSSFRMILGSGKVETFRNGYWCEAHQLHQPLRTGDRLHIGNTTLSYLIAYMTQDEYAQHFQNRARNLNPMEERRLVFQ